MEKIGLIVKLTIAAIMMIVDINLLPVIIFKPSIKSVLKVLDLEFFPNWF